MSTPAERFLKHVANVIAERGTQYGDAGGSMAATVMAPNGGVAALRWTNFNACLKLQKVSGNSGYTNKMFIGTPSRTYNIMLLGCLFKYFGHYDPDGRRV